MALEARQTRPDQEVRDLGAPAASVSAVLLWCVIDPEPQSFSSVNVRGLDQVVSIDIPSSHLLWFHDRQGNRAENFPEPTSASETLTSTLILQPLSLLLAQSWPGPAWLGDTIVQHQLKVWVRAG